MPRYLNVNMIEFSRIGQVQINYALLTIITISYYAEISKAHFAFLYSIY